MQTAATVKFERSGGLGIITLARPEKLNALDHDMRREFGNRLDEAAGDARVRIVLLRGEGRALCVGAEVSDPPSGPLAWRDRILLAQSHHMRIVRMQKPVVAAVQGVAVGGGSAALSQANASPALALDLLLTGGELSAREAAAAGLTRRAVPPAALDYEARALACQLLELPHEGLVITKALISQYWTAQLENALTHEADAFALATMMPGQRRAIARIRKKLAHREEA